MPDAGYIAGIGLWVPGPGVTQPEVAHIGCGEVIAEDANCLRTDRVEMAFLFVTAEVVEAWEIEAVGKAVVHREVEDLWKDAGGVVKTAHRQVAVKGQALARSGAAEYGEVISPETA